MKEMREREYPKGRKNLKLTSLTALIMSLLLFNPDERICPKCVTSSYVGMTQVKSHVIRIQKAS